MKLINNPDRSQWAEILKRPESVRYGAGDYRPREVGR